LLCWGYVEAFTRLLTTYIILEFTPFFIILLYSPFPHSWNTFFFNFYLFIYLFFFHSYVHTMFGSFLPRSPLHLTYLSHHWNSFNRSHFCKYIHVYTVFAPHSPSYTLSSHSPPTQSLVPTP
jgi:hypothetical protein